MHQELLKELAPTGVLRAGINLSNYLLVSNTDKRVVQQQLEGRGSKCMIVPCAYTGSQLVYLVSRISSKRCSNEVSYTPDFRSR